MFSEDRFMWMFHARLSPLLPPCARRLVPLLLLALGTLLFASPAALAERIRTLDGDADEEVTGFDPEGAGSLRTARRAIPIAEVKEVLFASAEREPRLTPARVFLTTGEELAGEITGGDDAKVVVKTVSLGVLEVSLDIVRAIAYPQDEPELRRFRREALPIDPKKDVAFTRGFARQEGVLERIDARGAALSAEGLGTLVLGPEKIAGVRVRPYGKPPVAPAGVRARLDLLDGSHIVGRLKALRNGTVLMDSPLKAGIEVKLSEVRILSFAGGRVAYLSDLEPVAVEERAKVISLVYPHRRDANIFGNPLRLDGKTYRKGLAVHAFSKLEYALDGAFARFRAQAGLDDEAREERRAQGTVVFQVLLDGKPALGAEGLPLTTDDPARLIDVDLTGVKRLTLVADFGPSEDTLARGLWADAHLIRK